MPTQHAAQNAAPWTQPAIQFLSGLVLGCIFGWFGHQFSVRRDRLNRARHGKDEFLSVIAAWDSQFSTCVHVDDRTGALHAASIVVIRDAVFALRAYVSAACFERVFSLWRQYESEHADAKSGLIARTAHELQHGPDSKTMPQYPDDLLRDYMRRFRSEVESEG